MDFEDFKEFYWPKIRKSFPIIAFNYLSLIIASVIFNQFFLASFSLVTLFNPFLLLFCLALAIIGYAYYDSAKVLFKGMYYKNQTFQFISIIVTWIITMTLLYLTMIFMLVWVYTVNFGDIFEQKVRFDEKLQNLLLALFTFATTNTYFIIGFYIFLTLTILGFIIYLLKD